MDEFYLLSLKPAARRKREFGRVSDALRGLDGVTIVGPEDVSVVKVRIAPDRVAELRERVADFCNVQKHSELELL